MSSKIPQPAPEIDSFLSSLSGSLPAVHELAEQAGIELPQVPGRLNDHGKTAHVESKPARELKMVPVITTGDELAGDGEKT